MFDKLIKGGLVVDGTGAAPFTADVAIEGGRIVEVGRVSGPARETLDADGLMVTPGFVDIHTHYDGQVSWDGLLSPSSTHGVTSLVMGNCGVGFAPARPDKRDWLIGLMEGVEDIPGSALADGIKWEWESFPEYMDAIDRRPLAVDIGAQMAHGALRAYVMGDRGARNEPATEADIAEMARLVTEAQAAGAMGFSTSRTILHRAVDGEPVPGTFAAEGELRAIAQALADAGHGLMEVAPAGISGEDLLAPAKELSWMNRISAETGCPITFLYGQNHVAPESWREMVAACAEGARAGARVTPQVIPRGVGLMVSLQGKFHPFVWTPAWKEMGDLPVAERVARIKADADLRRRLVEEGADSVMGIHKPTVNMPIAYHWDRTFSLGANPDYEPDPRESVEGRARSAGRNPREVALDLLLEDEGHGFLYYPMMGYADGDLNPSYEMLTTGGAVVGGSDGGAHVAVICDAGMPTFMLTHWSRDRSRGPRLPVELSVRKMTRDPAQLYGLKDRGEIRPGMRADVNLIDFQRLNVAKPYLAYDLPTGAPRLLQDVTGYEATLLKGEVTRRRGEDTGARPGAVIRSRAG
jgi:N-acyl-D-amino-acid deacylase